MISLLAAESCPNLGAGVIGVARRGREEKEEGRGEVRNGMQGSSQEKRRLGYPFSPLHWAKKGDSRLSAVAPGRA